MIYVLLRILSIRTNLVLWNSWGIFGIQFLTFAHIIEIIFNTFYSIMAKRKKICVNEVPHIVTKVGEFCPIYSSHYLSVLTLKLQ